MKGSLQFFESGMGNVEVHFVEYKKSMDEHDIYGVFNENIPLCYLTFKQIDLIKHKVPTSNYSGAYNEYDIIFSVNEYKYDSYVVTPAVVKIKITYDDWYISDNDINNAFSEMLDNISKYVNIVFIDGEKKKVMKAFKDRSNK